MAGDEERASERTHLVPHDRRLGSVVHEADAASVVSSRISKEEQLLGETAVGERLPYNDYTTIDWLHDLVRSISHNTGTSELTVYRSKTRSGIAQYMAEKASGMPSRLRWTHAKAGSQQR